MPQAPRQPRWYAIPVRVALLTFIGTLLSFALTLLVGIIGTVSLSLLRRTPVHMALAYRQVALPAALAAGAIIFLVALVTEVRHYRQSKTLAGIARVSG
ncbi:MAG TPA: hypothetical protein VND65_09035 [Candidatus Binatia bacterium]|nr:hypothetical protein [Candidatus Binatia bacterium]